MFCFFFLNVSVYCLYIYMWLSLLQAWMYQHFQGMGSKDVWASYRERDPHAMLFIPLSGLGTLVNYINHLDRLDLSSVVMAPYGEHRAARPFERVSLYSGWLRYGDRVMIYLPERVLRQLGGGGSDHTETSR
jgi:hypothetical protein